MSANERASIISELTPGHTIHNATCPVSPVVLSSPHSGGVYPRAFVNASKLCPLTLRKSEDTYVDELFASAPKLGAPLIAARFPRAFIDVNREPFELDPELFRDALPTYANTRSARVVGGLGTIARIVADAHEIYREPLSLSAGLERIKRLYRPYHNALEDLISRAVNRSGFAVLIDCHSMPSACTGTHSGKRPDIVLGDRFGCSCDRALTGLADAMLRDLGFEVALNRPYAGGFITEHYGKPALVRHALQIEINREIYMNEDTFERSSEFSTVQNAIAKFLERLIDSVTAVLQPRAAAE